MNDYQVVRYSSNNFDEWNCFVSKAKNATFLFDRNFMDYHKDRFEDFSLLIYKNDRLIALLPANRVEDVIFSHQGLSYGGLVLRSNTHFETILEALEAILVFFLDNKLEKFVVKQIPKMYLSEPSDELDYLMFILNAKLIRRDVSMSVKLGDEIKFSTLRKREIKKAEKLKLRFIEDDGFGEFWSAILIPNLKATFNVVPVHTLNEITLLKKKFPNNIKQFSVYNGDRILAGCTVFETKYVAHLQYISTNKQIKIGALDYLIYQLMMNVYSSKAYFDFGISNENNGKHVNLGLLNWKQSFGASSMVHDFYEVETANYSLLKNIVI